MLLQFVNGLIRQSVLFSTNSLAIGELSFCCLFEFTKCITKPFLDMTNTVKLHHTVKFSCISFMTVHPFLVFFALSVHLLIFLTNITTAINVPDSCISIGVSIWNYIFISHINVLWPLPELFCYFNFHVATAGITIFWAVVFMRFKPLLELDGIWIVIVALPTNFGLETIIKDLSCFNSNYKIKSIICFMSLLWPCSIKVTATSITSSYLIPGWLMVSLWRSLSRACWRCLSIAVL